jgi:hypothetical protein
MIEQARVETAERNLGWQAKDHTTTRVVYQPIVHLRGVSDQQQIRRGETVTARPLTLG